MAEHTPGPWKDAGREDPRSTWHYVEAREGGFKTGIATVRGDLKHPGGARFIGSPKANARLIAAAPDLLAACNAIKAWEDTPNSHYVAWPGTLHDAIEAARTAIDKATGEADNG